MKTPHKMLFLAIAGLVSVLAAWTGVANATDADAAERLRIARERSAVEAAFAREESACYSRFAVNECRERALAVRRNSLADLRRQEVALNDQQRKRKAAQQVQEVEARSRDIVRRQGAEVRLRSAASAPTLENRETAAPSASMSSAAVAPAARGVEARDSSRDAARRANAAAQRAEQAKRRVSEAERRKADNDIRRQRGNAKPPAKPLPSVEQ